MRKIVFYILTLLVASPFIFAAETGVSNRIEGKWKTIDDKTDKATSIVHLWVEKDGSLHGKVESLILEPGEDPNPLCDKCSGERKDKPVIGMEIVFGFPADTKVDEYRWEGGSILDPDNGETYGCNFTLDKDNTTLKVRGYIGFSLLGRTQKWIRVK